MASKVLLEITTDQEINDVNDQLANTGEEAWLQNLVNYIGRIKASIVPATFGISQASQNNVSLVKATATIVSAGAAVADETLTVCNVVFTAKASGATGNQFNLSATPATQATNIANAINNSANLSGIVTAAAVTDTVTLTAVVPGVQGNGLQISESMTNVTVTQFANGAVVVPSLYLALLNGTLTSHVVNR